MLLIVLYLFFIFCNNAFVLYFSQYRHEHCRKRDHNVKVINILSRENECVF